jgi:hypothetical protein
MACSWKRQINEPESIKHGLNKLCKGIDLEGEFVDSHGLSLEDASKIHALA